VDVTADLDAPVTPAALFQVVEELDRYPAWLDIVPRAERADAAAGDAGPAWTVDLRGRVGPIARSKRLRMVRTVHRPDSLVRFERAELDGRQHSPWVLTAEVSPGRESVAPGPGSRLVVRMHYGGGLFGPVLERILGEEIERSKPRLLALLGV
jgi:hypothetical protein